MARAEQGTQKALKGKIVISAKLKVLTGMHIGGASDFAPIGSVDRPFIRDPYSKEPIIPGSSIKGKMRTLLAKSKVSGYILNKIDEDDIVIKRLFGSAGKNMAIPARLQFVDLFVTRETIEKFANFDTDTYLGEVKFENTISRLTGSANPRQIERVPAGTEFNFKLVYNVETAEEIEEDMQLLSEGFTLIQADYLGGHGSRGYGRIKLSDFEIKLIGNLNLDTDKIKKCFERSSLL